MSEDRANSPIEPDEVGEPAPGAEHGETRIDPDADTTWGTGAALEHVHADDVKPRAKDA